MTKDTEVRWYIIRRVMQERTWGRSAERKRRRVIALQGGSVRPSAVGNLLVPLSLLTFPCLFLPISPVVYEGSLHTHTTTQTCTKEARRFHFQLICLTLCFIFIILNTPHASFLSISLSLQKYADLTHAHAHTFTINTQNTLTHTYILWEGLSNGFWRFQFPLCHQRQKTLWAQLPLSHTHTGWDHVHAHTNMHEMDASSLVFIDRRTHIHAHLKPLWHAENHTIRVTQANWKEY